MATAENDLNPNERNESLWRQSYDARETETSGFSLGDRSVNVNETERVVSGVSGGALVAYGLSQGGILGYGLAALGAGLLYRGVTGHCDVYAAAGVNTAESENSFVSVRGDAGVKVEKAVTIDAPVDKLYGFWRKFENLPKFMNHLESVVEIDDQRSHWKAKAPLGYTVEWDAEIVSETANNLISWRSTEGSEIPNAGSVHFTPATGGRGTVVKVSLKYEPPAGKLGAALAWLFGEEPNVQVMDDLRRFKRLMEAGEIPTVEGQTSGRSPLATSAA